MTGAVPRKTWLYCGHHTLNNWEAPPGTTGLENAGNIQFSYWWDVAICWSFLSSMLIFPGYQTDPAWLFDWRLLRGGSSLFRLILQNHEKYTVWNFASFNSTNHLEGVDFPPGSASINWRFFSEHRNNRFSGHGLETLQTQSFFWTVKFRWPLANTFGELTGSKKNHCSLVFKISDKSETNCWIIKLLTSYPEWNGN